MSTFCRITGKSRGLPKSNYFPLLPPISPADAKRFCRVTGKSYGLPAHHYIPVLVTTKPKKKAAQVPIPIEGHENGLLTKSHVHVADYRYVFPVCEDSSDLLQLLDLKNIESNAHYIYKVAERRCNLVFPARMEAAVRDGEIKNVMLAKDSDTLLLRLKNSGDVAIDVKDIDIEGLELYDGEGPSEEAVNERRKRKKNMNSLITALGKVVREKENEAELYEEEERKREIKRAKEREDRKKNEKNMTGQVNGCVTENQIENGHEYVNGNGEFPFEIDGNENMNEMNIQNANDNKNGFTNHNGDTIEYDVGNKPPQNFTKQNTYVVNDVEVKPQHWSSFRNDPADIITKASSQELGPLFENNDWSELDKNPLHKGHPVADKMPTPCVLEPEIVDLSTSLPGLIQAPSVISNTVGFEVTSAVHPVTPLTAEPDKQLLDSIKNLGPAELLKAADANEIFSKDIHSVNMLPTASEILEVLGKLGNGVVSTVGNSNSDVSGLKVDIREASKFIVGLTVSTPAGDIFVPGQTVHTPNGDQFIPGFTVKTSDGVPQLLPGQILQITDNTTGEKRPTFVAGQILNTREGEKFVPGQVIETKEGKKFVPGQTVHAPHSLQFIPGQICTGETPENAVFIPGLTELDCVGHKFVPGQMSTNQKGQLEFMPGQCEFTGERWDFVPGQTLISTNGELKFVPGQTIDSKDGPTFVPGQSVKDKYGERKFVPGVVVEGEKGLTFVPGAAIKTPGGQQFVEGQLFRSSSGKVSFIPGVTEVSEQGTYEFAAARVVKDIVYRDSMSLGISIDNAAINTTDKADTIYGHIVQTVQGVEFFPGVASGLPAGKVVPGRLVRGKEVKFVPGLLIDDKFVPGQVVSTEKGDQFVPGQVVETKYGPKFVPGQIVETRSGPKFVPGQTVETDDGPKFVPGQIVETKAGPTFIPGQVIHTDDEGSKFVPGQVVETIEGPRFVPGRVVETGDKVSFVPGQVVETAEGLRFVAPDLENDPEGDVQFTVQGFEITPEELGLLRPNTGSNSIFAPASGETTIDSRMMRQLSEAGMAVGRQVPADIPVVDVKVIPAMGLACSLRDRLPGSIDPVTTIKLSQVLATVASLDWSIPLNGSDLIDNAKEGMIVKSLLKAASMTNNDIDRFRNINTALEAALLSENKEEIITLVDNLHKFIVSSPILEPLRPKKKIVILKDIIVGNSYNEQEIVEKLSYILNDTDEPIVEGFKNFSKGNPDIVGKIVQRMTDFLDKIETEKDASEALQRAIREVVRESSEISVQDVLHHATSENVKNMFLEAIGLAKAMGLRDVAHTLMDAIADPKRAELLVNDRVTFEILRRLTVMRHLADKRPKFNTALLQLKIDPDEAKSDPLVRELVRESGALMIIPEDNAKLKTAQDVPMSLLVNNNSLAMEDFMLKNKKTGILVILKHGFQCVVPREASKLVLTGKVPYTVLDDTGLTMFAPMHVFSALHIPKVYANRFTMYSVVEEEEPATLSTLTPATSTDEVRTSP